MIMVGTWYMVSYLHVPTMSGLRDEHSLWVMRRRKRRGSQVGASWVRSILSGLIPDPKHPSTSLETTAVGGTPRGCVR